MLTMLWLVLAIYSCISYFYKTIRSEEMTYDSVIWHRTLLISAASACVVSEFTNNFLIQIGVYVLADLLSHFLILFVMEHFAKQNQQNQ